MYVDLMPTIPAGTHIYLTRKPNHLFYIKPDKSLLNDSLYVLYDVRVDGVTLIPRGTRVCGDWVTESFPNVAAQFQMNRIYLVGNGQLISLQRNLIMQKLEVPILFI
jgi:hypothetical protein